jgi:type IV pilus assembly protein PilP
MNPIYLFKTIIFRLSYLCVFLLIACSDEQMPDLKNYVEAIKAQPGEGIDDLSEMSNEDFFYFELDDLRDPFVATENIMAVENLNNLPSKKVANGVQPDFSRIKEELESFPLESLEMVGTVKKSQILWGLIRSEEGIQRVKVGNYIGQNHGKILEILATGLKLVEIFKEKGDKYEWIKQETELPLKMDIDEQE